MNHIEGERAVFRLAQEKPDWIPIIEAAWNVNQRIEGEEFAGSWVLEEATQQGVTIRKPNLRTLAAYGIIEKVDTARAGRRAYYSMPDPEGVKKALVALSKQPAIQ